MTRALKVVLALFVGCTVIVIVSILIKHPEVIFRKSRIAPTISCLAIPDGPELTFADGAVLRAGNRIASYEIDPAIPGKHGPRLAVSGIGVSEDADGLSVTSGTEEWYWPIRPNGEVEIYYYPQNMVVANPCEDRQISAAAY
jgi:hypothetical protein